MSIKIDKKYVGHFMTNDYRVGDSVSVKIGCALITAIDGDEYTLEMPNAERDEDKSMGRPPLGITPKNMHDDFRVKDLIKAMSRYSESSKSIPIEWIDELKLLQGN
jgi:hypothetical protein